MDFFLDGMYYIDFQFNYQMLRLRPVMAAISL